MKQGLIHIYSGDGHGKSPAALGKAVMAAAAGERVVIIQFLKGRGLQDTEFIRRLEPEIKIFRFEKRDCCYEQLTEEEKAEERSNILNGLNFARKVVVTQECDFLLLDEILGLLDRGIVTVDAIIDILKQKDESMHIVMTGWNFPEELKPYVDTITTLNSEEVHHSCEQQ